MIDAHWHPDRMCPIYAQQGRLDQYLAGDNRQPQVRVRVVGGVAVYCDFSNPQEHIIDPGWVNARGVHPSSIRT